MADDQNNAPELLGAQTDGAGSAQTAGSGEDSPSGEKTGIFSDLLDDAPISNLHIEEPEFSEFDMAAVLEEARAITTQPKEKTGRFGKRIRKTLASVTGSQNHASAAKSKPAAQKAETKETVLKDETIEKKETKPVRSVLKDESMQSLLFDERMKTMEDLVASLPDQSEPANEEADTPPVEKELSFEELIRTQPVFEDEEEKPKTFMELLKSGFGSKKDEDGKPVSVVSEAAIDVEIPEDETASNSQTVLITRTQTMPSLSEQVREMEEKKKEEAKRKALEKAERKARKEEEKRRREEEGVYDPKASLVDDFRYDEYLDKKHFLLSDYKKTEDYLNKQSRQGFHYVHHEGKKFYFIKGKPHNFYYKILYFSKEPSEEYWDRLEQDGWKEIDTSPSRNRRDAGWYVVRNERKEGDLSKVIANEEEKYRYFSKFSSSCRSTMFLLFVIMVCCLLTMWLQYEFKGFMEAIIISGVLFVIALYFFIVYARMLNKSRKQASLLAARLRLADNDPKYQALLHAKDSDEELEQAWEAIDEHEESEH